ncbi:hypothetical protein GPJ56_002292 [Histomonas meleagridis]|uniref:uncharacterized protein n=1 Tax=Histomonas meleagridis TaxID=135588 RepID=UPI003559D934|nr:hypothetical protein GPJ56_002292 [Histomonas meleagridis]KAH0804554.1 hypothetical protein GO595_003384 [Histomonas meleagridis]
MVFDPDFGISSWYLKPTFFLKIVCGIISGAFLIYLIILDVMVNDVFFPVACTGTPRNIAITITIFLLLICILYPIYAFKFGQYKVYGLIGFSVFAVIILVLSISYAVSFAGSQVFDKYYEKAMTYASTHPKESRTDYFKEATKYELATSDLERRKSCLTYFNNRLHDAGEIVLGLSVTCFILFVLVEGVFYIKGESYQALT